MSKTIPNMSSLQDILDAAERHGSESDPDHEVGDLQDMLRTAWDMLPKTKRSKLLLEAAEQLDSWDSETSCLVCDEVGPPDCKGCGGQGLVAPSGRKLTEV